MTYITSRFEPVSLVGARHLRNRFTVRVGKGAGLHGRMAEGCLDHMFIFKGKPINQYNPRVYVYGRMAVQEIP